MIFPLHKKKERNLLENYRPVSHLVQVGLMVEYAVYFQIVDHFLQNDLFHPNHHGSIANHSTATSILQLQNIWLEAAERQELSAVCFLDQSAAYDLLCHQTLREKLELFVSVLRRVPTMYTCQLLNGRPYVQRSPIPSMMFV